MTRGTVRHALQAFFEHAKLAQALSILAIGVGVFAFALQRTMGLAGMIAALATLVPLCAASLFARRRAVEWLAVIPLSMVVFLFWAIASVFWSQYQWATIAGLTHLLAYTALGIMVALTRDTIQIIRAVGDVLRAMLAVSLVLEVLSGLLIDTPIRFLDIAGNLHRGGPIQGIVGNHNELGLLAVIGGITFMLEWRTRSMRASVALGSFAAAGLTLLLTRSFVAWVTAAVAIVAFLAIAWLRRIRPERRTFWQYAVLGLTVIAAIVLWMLRSPIVAALNASGEMNVRLRLWQQVLNLASIHPVEGWGWIGQWHVGLGPFTLFGASGSRPVVSASNAYLDVLFQLGTVGFVIFLGMLGLAFVRSWLLGARQRSVIFTWPAIVLASLLVASLAESTILSEFAWLLFVICCVKASQQLSWRNAFRRPLEPEPLR